MANTGATKKRPIISVIVPTRNRPDTLASCLSSLRHHKSKQIEIIVQDNCSTPDTKALILEAQQLDPRIVYSCAPYPTSQRHNFELGVSASTGDYISIIGDDDGYVLGSLDWLAKHLKKNPVDAVRWRLVHYAWPSLSEDDEGFVRIYSTDYYGGWINKTSDKIVEDTINATNAGSWDNILVYHGMISRKLYDRVRAMTNGIFFHYPLPDVYAHNLLAFHCEKLLYVDNPVSIYGTSGHSAGSSWARETKKKGKAADAGQKWIDESRADPIADEVAWQPEIRTLRYHDYQVVKFGQSRSMLGGKKVDQAKWIAAIIKEIESNPWSLTPWFTAKPKADDDEVVFAAVRKHFAALKNKIPVAPGNRYPASYPTTLLRVRYSKKKLNDDIEGAMLALAELMDDGGVIFEAAKIEPEASFKMRIVQKARDGLIFAADRTPEALVKLMRSPNMPHYISRTLRRWRWPETERVSHLSQRLAQLYEAGSKK